MAKARRPGARFSRLTFGAGIALKVVLSLIVYAMPILGFWLASSLAAYRGGATWVPLVAGLVAFPFAPLIWDIAAEYRRNKRGDTRERFLPAFLSNSAPHVRHYLHADRRAAGGASGARVHGAFDAR